MEEEDCPKISDCPPKPWLPECEDEGDICENFDADRCSLCGQVTEYLKKLIRAPTDKCSAMQYLLAPIRNSEVYQKYARCKIELIAYAVAIFGVSVTMYSLFEMPWAEDVKSCYESDNKDCTTLWWFLSMFLFIKAITLNVMGVLTNFALLIAIYLQNLDCIYLWLVWRTMVIFIGILSIPLLAVFTLSITQELNMEIFMEAARLLGNLVALVIIYAIYEKYAGCLEGGVGDEDNGAEEAGFLSGRPRRARKPAVLEDN